MRFSVTLDRNDNDQRDAVAQTICDNEFGVTRGEWKRLLARAEQDPRSYAADKVVRLRGTARDVITALVRGFSEEG